MNQKTHNGDFHSDSIFIYMHQYSILLFCVMVFYACNKTNNGSSVTGPPPSDSATVYIAGYEISNLSDSGFAVVWKNGSIIRLSDGAKNDGASSVFVSGNDVYAAGAERPMGGPYFAKYWKNNTPFVVGDSGTQARAITVSGNDVYVAGFAIKTDLLQAEYWKNGNQINLTDGSSYAEAFSIAVAETGAKSGGNVYVAGSMQTSQYFFPRAVYWLNGNPVILPSGPGTSVATSIYISGNDVYIAGHEDLTTTQSTIAKYWKNGIPVNLSDSPHVAHANSIFVSGNDVYVAGVELSGTNNSSEEVKYWKNGASVILAGPIINGGEDFASSIFVLGNDVYVLGYWLGSPTIWKNGKSEVVDPFVSVGVSSNIYVTK